MGHSRPYLRPVHRQFGYALGDYHRCLSATCCKPSVWGFTDSFTAIRIGFIGLSIVLFWVLTAIFADQIITHGSSGTVRGDEKQETGLAGSRVWKGEYFLLGGDNLARDVFSAAWSWASRTVMSIAPAATLFAFMVGITLGLPAGYLHRAPGYHSSALLPTWCWHFPVILLCSTCW